MDGNCGFSKFVVHYVWSLLLVPVALVALGASAPWTKTPAQWTSADIERVLTESPWAQQAAATFGRALEPDDMPVTPPPGAEGNLPDSSRGVSDGRWDGGVARNTGIGETPTLTVTVRWDSAAPVREALSRSRQDDGLGSRAEIEYIVTVLGLASAASKNPPSNPGDESEGDKQTGGQDPAQIARAFSDNSRLILRSGRMVVSPDDANYDPATGAIHLLFPRSTAIKLADKEVTLVTRYGSLSVRKKFRLKEMTYKGQLEL